MAANKKLPKNLSDLIDVALADLSKVEKSAKYEVNMYDWHSGQDCSANGKCLVCLAGSVIAMSLEADPSTQKDPDSYDNYTATRLCALDLLRKGEIDFALRKIDRVGTLDRITKVLVEKNLPVYVSIPPYEKDRTKFKKALRKLSKQLRQAGL